MQTPLRLKSTFRRRFYIVLCLLALMLTVGVQSASANINGAIQSTFNTGTTVNGNLFPSKFAVYLNGGPQNESSNGLPDGIYYFQVTDPNGSHLLSTDDITCRQVQVIGGRFQGVPSIPVPATCTASDGGTGDFHANGLLNAANGGSIPVQLCAKSGCPEGAPLSSPDFENTDNTGGEYKVWITPVAQYDAGNADDPHKNFGFDGATKTDNFKVRPVGTFNATVSVCKFKDVDGDGLQDNGDPLIPHWPITATGVDPTNGNPTVTGTTVSTQTGDNGCVAFTYSGGQANHTITLSEGLLTNWTATAPPDGACTLTGTVNAADTCSVAGTGGTITITVNDGDLLNVPDFGNHPPCTTGCGVLTVTKTANPSLTRTFKWDISKSVDKTEIDTSGSATFNYTVSVTHDTGTDSKWQLTGSIRLGNATIGDVTGVVVTDTVDNGGSCTVDTTGFNGTVPANNHVDLPYTCTYANAPSPAASTNHVTVSSDEGPFVGQQDFDFGAAAVTLVDDSVTVTDTFGGNLGTVSSTDPSPTTFPYSHTFTDPAGTCTTHDNTATFTTDTTGATGSDSKSVKVCVGADLTVSKTATPTFNSSITKSPNQTEFDTSSGNSVTITYTVTVTESGWQVAGNITVANPNDWEDITANLSDAIPGASCTVNGGTTSVLVNRSSSVTVPYTCTFASAPSSASGTNTATASWIGASTPDTSANGSANYTFGSLTVTDAFNGGGAVTLGTISTPTATSTFTDLHTVTAPTATCTIYNNTAAIAETNQTSSASVKVCGASPLTVIKDANPSFNSNITKTASPGSPAENAGSTTFTYTITVTESGWKVTGNVSVTNPNNWESIALTSVADSLTGAICSVSPATIPASSTVNLPYSCTFNSVPAATGTNYVTITWNAATAFTTTGSASANKSYAFAPLTVTDTFGSGSPVTLGTIPVPTATTKFTDTKTLSPIGGSCTSVTNTATITPTGQIINVGLGYTTAQATVTACNTATGALTMGFWKNKNGQGIITGGSSTGGVCNSGTWLRQFAPFQDLSATASCSQVASYVSNILSSASAGGAAMNPMLKGQMLSTALDVYFSDLALGGNKIGAAQALGGVKIDLTHVCKMIDSSGGTGTCSGSFENSSSAFGGATSGTVSFLLSYAASQSNSGGSIWYGQNKTTQGLAKDTFDEINNQVATIAP